MKKLIILMSIVTLLFSTLGVSVLSATEPSPATTPLPPPSPEPPHYSNF